MKSTLLVFTLFLLASCSDSLRTRVGKCSTPDNRFAECASVDDALATDKEDFRKLYIAEVTIPVSVNKDQLSLNESAHDSDHDQEQSCDIDVVKGTQFNYEIREDELLLKNGAINLVLTKTNGFSSDNLTGSWSMTETTEKTRIITELTFSNLEELEIRKTCYLK